MPIRCCSASVPQRRDLPIPVGAFSRGDMFALLYELERAAWNVRECLERARILLMLIGSRWSVKQLMVIKMVNRMESIFCEFAYTTSFVSSTAAGRGANGDQEGDEWRVDDNLGELPGRHQLAQWLLGTDDR